MKGVAPSLAGSMCLLVAGLLISGGTAIGGDHPPGVLPVFIEDNHAGSFGFFASALDLDRPHTLVHIDAHSDATAVDHSDQVREGIRRVNSDDERRSRIDSWRKSGRIQAYNWIEPLMPRPFSEIVWISAAKLDELKRRRLAAEAAESLDGRFGFEARQSGEFAASLSVAGFDGLEKLADSSTPIAVTLDLDVFAGLSREEASRQIEELWSRIVRWPRLCALSIAISRPWLSSDDEAWFLLDLALEKLTDTLGTKIEIQPWLRPQDRDDSLRAREIQRQGKDVPRLDWAKLPARLRSRLLNLGGRVNCRERSDDWQAMKAGWLAETELPSVRVAGATRGLDDVWRLAASKTSDATIRLTDSPRTATGRMRWFALEPRAPAWNLLPETGLAKAFVDGSCSPWVSETRQLIGETSDPALSATEWLKRLPKTGFGRVRLAAEIETAEGWLPLPAIEIRVFDGEAGSFHAALSEQFGLPYVFGIGLTRDQNHTGAEVGWGNDCANFLVAAWRRSGRNLPWCNPAQLRERLRPLSKTMQAGQIDPLPVSDESIRRGIVIDFGQHVAALWKDEPPLGQLDDSDLVAHHLGGLPEIVDLRELLRNHPSFVVRSPDDTPACTLVFGGDVVLTDATQESVARVFVAAPKHDLLAINLEGIPSLREPKTKSRFDFRFAPDQLSLLREQRVSFVSHGNNHAMDAGADGLREGLDALRSTGLPVIGAGVSADEAVRPLLLESHGVKLAIFGVACLPIEAAGESKPGVCQLPAHQTELVAAMQRAKEAGRTVIVMPHWGTEYSEKVDDSQCEWAKWFVAHGASAIIGSHPHVVQPLDYMSGVPVAFSLGNCVYPAKLRGADSGAWLGVKLDSRGKVMTTNIRRMDR